MSNFIPSINLLVLSTPISTLRLFKGVFKSALTFILFPLIVSIKVFSPEPFSSSSSSFFFSLLTSLPSLPSPSSSSSSLLVSSLLILLSSISLSLSSLSFALFLTKI